jgi:Replication-relaxation
METHAHMRQATYQNTASPDAVYPTNREVRWLKHLERHGPQSSIFLHELTKNTHRCKDTALRQLQNLRLGGFLMLPPQQRATMRAECNPYIYDLTLKAKRWLADHDLAEPTVRPTGHWWHGFAVACATSALDIAAARGGVRFIPTHDILARRGAPLAIPVAGRFLIPDQLFAFDYGNRFRTFALEVDRGTEPITSPANRKSLLASVDAYTAMIARDLGRAHYGLKSSLLALWVFATNKRAATFLDVVRVRSGKAASSFLVQANSALHVPSSAPQTDLFLGDWQRADGSQVNISRLD